jgi:hypothetical protein
MTIFWPRKNVSGRQVVANETPAGGRSSGADASLHLPLKALIFIKLIFAWCSTIIIA